MSETQEPQMVRYLSRHVKGLKVNVPIARGQNKLIQAVNGIITMTVREAEAFDGLLKTRPDLRHNVQKIDGTVDAAAVERQRQILEAKNRKGPSASKGALHSGTTSREQMRQSDLATKTVVVPAAVEKTAEPYVEQPVIGDTAQVASDVLAQAQRKDAPKLSLAERLAARKTAT